MSPSTEGGENSPCLMSRMISQKYHFSDDHTSAIFPIRFGHVRLWEFSLVEPGRTTVLMGVCSLVRESFSLLLSIFLPAKMYLLVR